MQLLFSSFFQYIVDAKDDLVSYKRNKIDSDEEVLYFGVWIKSQNTEWPESEKRKRKFLTLEKALKKPLSFGSRKVLNTIQKAMLHSKKNIVQVMGIETLHKKSKETKPKNLAA